MTTAISHLRAIVVIPAFRESVRLPAYLAQLSDALRLHPPFETNILVVDDGSPADEQKITTCLVETAAKNSAAILPPLLLEKNVGKGAAIMAGWHESKGARWLAFADADGAVSASEVIRLLRIMDTDDPPDAIFASRVKMLGRRVNRGWKRHLSGRVFAHLVGLLIEPNVYDSQCGFKIISAEAWQAIAPKLTENRFIFDVDLLAALQHQGFQVWEVPVNWTDVPGSKVSLLRDTLRMIAGIYRIYLKKRHGRY